MRTILKTLFVAAGAGALGAVAQTVPTVMAPARGALLTTVLAAVIAYFMPQPHK